MLRSTEAQFVVRRMTGRTQSILMACDDNRYYVVKFKNNPDGIRALANEVITTRLAQYLQLPVPEIAFVYVSSKLIEIDRDLSIRPPRSELFHRPRQLQESIVPCEPGIQFGSLHPVTYSAQAIDYLPHGMTGRVVDLAAFVGALILDAWTGAEEARQAILVRNDNDDSYKPLFIDHHRSIPENRFLDPKKFIDARYPNLEVYETVKDCRSFEPWLELAENAPRRILEEAVSDFPEEWNIHRKWSEGTVEYLKGRQETIRDYLMIFLASTLQEFPAWKGINRASKCHHNEAVAGMGPA